MATVTFGDDFAVVCANGHTINQYSVQRPDMTRPFCARCGARAIAECPGCGRRIEKKAGVTFDPRHHDHCAYCGAAMPWSKTIANTAAVEVPAVSRIAGEQRVPANLSPQGHGLVGVGRDWVRCGCGWTGSGPNFGRHQAGHSVPSTNVPVDPPPAANREALRSLATEAADRLAADSDIKAGLPNAEERSRELRLWIDRWEQDVEAGLVGDDATLTSFRRPVDTSQMHYVESPLHVLRTRLQRLQPYVGGTVPPAPVHRPAPSAVPPVGATAGPENPPPPGEPAHVTHYLSQLPPDLDAKFHLESDSGRQMLLVERWDDAFEVFRWVFEQLIRAQPENGRFHKGSPLHNMAVARLQGGYLAQGLKWTLMAFIEDALSRAEESPSHWDELQRPAANLLRLLGLGEEELYGLAERVRARVREGELVSDPTMVFVDEKLDRQVRLVADTASGGVARAGPEIRVFVSSPGDLRAERRLVAEVCREVSSTLGLRLRALLWEGGGPRNPEAQPFPSDVTGQATQAVLDEYVWDALGGYDVYVGMLWKRMGTPTGGWHSGTEAEFRYALRARQESKRPRRIAFYCKRSRPSDRVDPEVGRFIEELRGLGLVQSFVTRGDLRRMLVDHLSLDARQALAGQSRMKDSGAAVTAHLRQLVATSRPGVRTLTADRSRRAPDPAAEPVTGMQELAQLEAGDFAPPSPPGDRSAPARRAPTSSTQPSIRLDLRYHGDSQKLELVNNGTEPVFDVALEFPSDAAPLAFQGGLPISEIPAGRSVNMNAIRLLSAGPDRTHFNVHIRGRTADNQQVEQDAFLDLLG